MGEQDLLDPAVEESLMSGGVELPAQTQQELSMLEELLGLYTAKLEKLMITCVYQRSPST